jgi:hypothetical protein
MNADHIAQTTLRLATGEALEVTAELDARSG